MRKKCKLCSSGNIRLLFISENVHGRHVLSKDRFGIYECLTCKVTFTDVTPTDSEYYKKYYKSDYYLSDAQHGAIVLGMIKLLRVISHLRNLRIIDKYKPQGNKILEIGCGNGSFLHGLPSYFEKYGIEINHDGYRFIKENYKDIKVYNTKIGDDALNEGVENYDVVVMWNVLEHINDPINFIKIVSSTLLANDGVLIFDVPNRNSLGFRATQKNWFHIDTPRHLFHYQYSVIECMLSAHGLKIIKVSGNPIDYFHDLAVSVYGRVLTGSSLLNLIYGVTIIPAMLLVRLIVSLFLPRYAEINTYIVKPLKR